MKVNWQPYFQKYVLQIFFFFKHVIAWRGVFKKSFPPFYHWNCTCSYNLMKFEYKVWPWRSLLAKHPNALILKAVQKRTSLKTLVLCPSSRMQQKQRCAWMCSHWTRCPNFCHKGIAWIDDGKNLTSSLRRCQLGLSCVDEKVTLLLLKISLQACQTKTQFEPHFCHV